MERGSRPSSTKQGFQVPHHRRGAATPKLPRQRKVVCERQLIVTWWPDGSDPLVIAPLSSDKLALLKPGFAAWYRSSLVIPYHPHARLEHRLGQAALYVGGQLIAHGPAPNVFTEDQCMVGIVERNLLPLRAGDHAELFLSLLELGVARIADVPIRGWQSPDTDEAPTLHEIDEGPFLNTAPCRLRMV